MRNVARCGQERIARYLGAEAIATIRTVWNSRSVASRSTRKKDAREDRDAKGPNSRFEWFFQGCNGAGGRRPASPYENTRPVLRPNWLSPGASSRSRRKQTFLRLPRRSVFFFFPQPPFRGWLLRERRVEYLRPFARFVTRPRRRSIRRSFSGDSRVRASNASNADERKEKGGEDDPTRERKLKPAIARRRGRTKTRSCE